MKVWSNKEYEKLNLNKPKLEPTQIVVKKRKEKITQKKNIKLLARWSKKGGYMKKTFVRPLYTSYNQNQHPKDLKKETT